MNEFTYQSSWIIMNKFECKEQSCDPDSKQKIILFLPHMDLKCRPLEPKASVLPMSPTKYVVFCQFSEKSQNSDSNTIASHSLKIEFHSCKSIRNLME